ncbi:short-chain dehydrogenase [Suillus clintonianus]|uniref:short-chain dehydrogenase n=1 Tax=Suillus clintonianus TaxID=1904413 RepID=UPI001B85ED64|nr:short-chain dehydrogenase [Suillus clintonianus]KAG2135459.1 short-chain dehydrogenase [Suillus clintonianus]
MGKFVVSEFLCEQRKELPVASTDISDKSILVVGANVGLGFEASVHLAQLRPKHLLVTARDATKCQQTIADVQQRASIDTIDARPLELGSFESVSQFVNQFEEEGFQINALVANAGIQTTRYSKTVDGWETTLQVNYLSTALLSILMLPHLLETSTPQSASRLIIVSSELHYLANKLSGADRWPSILEKLNDPDYCTSSVMSNRYNLSKMLEVMFVRELSSRLPEPTPVAVSAVNPGFCHSRLSRSTETNPFKTLGVATVKALLARTTEMGSRTLVHPVVEPGELSRHGRYLSCCEPKEESDYVISTEGREVSRRLWLETIDVLSKADPRVQRIVDEHLRSR